MPILRPPDPHRPEGARHVKFRVDRDVLADAVAWAARSLPVRPSVPVLAGLLIEAGRRRPGALDLRLRDLGPRHAPGRGRRRGPRPGQRPAARRHLPQPARPSRSRWCIDGARVSLTCGSARFSLQTMPVEDYPTLPDMPAATGTVPERRLRARRRPGGHRRRPRRHAAGADRRPDRDRRLDDLAARHRPVPALPPRARLGPAHPRRHRWPRWCRPGCSATPPSR